MKNIGITAEEARKNTESSNNGVKDIFQQLDPSIEANSKAGATSITSMFNIEGWSDQDFDQAISILKERGFEASYSTNESIRTVKVSW